ncbi:response regulator transcription factor [Neobacillus sp. 179-C4.2 HS]|uniref:Response regulator transcription factor n=1 Tax=Neobacillus driksii TaxID=3035913 RepID=A0ABV4YY23_9BACI|nr:response regulator transcription factor [Neobacillus sp. 179.-C4.2 HS]MDP5192249.1 response regulator transcription factor [Neobacillus sp. 179.-C4.2 HS]
MSTKKGSILVVEDEEKIARVLELELEYEGYKVTKVIDGLEALEAYRTGSWDLILLDVMLPGLSGIELLRRIRKNDLHTPVILLTAKSSVEDKVSGLDLGANDYITKPFQIEELLARIRAALRIKRTEEEHPQNENDDLLRFADLSINQKSREVIRGDGESIDLTPREYDLLVYLMVNKRQVLSRDQILEAVWGYDFFGDTNVVDVYIRYVRKKIDLPHLPSLIHTVRGVGYVMKDSK